MDSFHILKKKLKYQMRCSHANEKYFLMRRKIMSGAYGKYLDYLQNIPIYVVDTT
jgi:hypothetical protein